MIGGCQSSNCPAMACAYWESLSGPDSPGNQTARLAPASSAAVIAIETGLDPTRGMALTIRSTCIRLWAEQHPQPHIYFTADFANVASLPMFSPAIEIRLEPTYDMPPCEGHAKAGSRADWCYRENQLRGAGGLCPGLLDAPRGGSGIILHLGAVGYRLLRTIFTSDNVALISIT
jgi:hypothetical protein